MKSTGTTCKRHEQEVYDMLLEYSTKWNTRISLDALPPDQAGHRKFKVELLSCDEETFEAVDDTIAGAMGKVLAMIKEMEDVKN
jgi:hypothetical protein